MNVDQRLRPRAPGRLEGDTQGARATDALLEVREEGCQGGGGCGATVPRTEHASTAGKVLPSSIKP